MIDQIELIEDLIHKLLNVSELKGIIIPIIVHYSTPDTYKTIPVISLKSTKIEDIMNSCIKYMHKNPIPKNERRLVLFTTYINTHSNCVAMYPGDQKKTHILYYRLFEKNKEGNYRMTGTLFKTNINK